MPGITAYKMKKTPENRGRNLQKNLFLAHAIFAWGRKTGQETLPKRTQGSKKKPNPVIAEATRSMRSSRRKKRDSVTKRRNPLS